MIGVIKLIAVIAYACASLLLSRRFIVARADSPSAFDKFAHSGLPILCGVVGIALHTFVLMTLFSSAQSPDLTMVNVASLLAWIMVITIFISSAFIVFVVIITVIVIIAITTFGSLTICFFIYLRTLN